MFYIVPVSSRTQQLWPCGSGSRVWWFLRKLDIILPEDPAIPLLGIYPEDAPTGKKDTMFIAALFIIARSRKEPRCPSTEEWIQKMWHIYTMEYYSVIISWPRYLLPGNVCPHQFIIFFSPTSLNLVACII